MTQLLHIDASPRGERSHSRKLSQEFVDAWLKTHPTDEVTYRDIGRNPIPHISEEWIAAAYTPPEQRTPPLKEAIQLSDQLLDELFAADLFVIGTPMYNFGIPSTFKAYIDQIVRIGRTFNFTPENPENPYQPLVLGKKMIVISARGGSGFGPGGPFAHYNYQTTYLAAIFGFIGVTDITFIDVENDEQGGKALEEAIANARTQIATVAKQDFQQLGLATAD